MPGLGTLSVSKVLDEHERSMAFAEVALGQIRSLRQTAVPRNYEIWYVYATGYNAPLNKIINETLARTGELTEADLDQIYDTYLSQIKTTDRIDIPEDRALRSALHAVRRIPTAGGHFRFDADRTEAGHADEFWALALGLLAADGKPVSNDFIVRPGLTTYAQAGGFL